MTPLKFVIASILFLFFLNNAFSQTKNLDTLPHPVGWTNDLEHLYTKTQIRKLDSIISSFEHKSTIEICIVTLDSSLTTKEEFDGFVTHIHDEWGIGKKETNNGIVIGISKQFRKMRISTGLGLVKNFPNTEAKKIIDNDFIPSFKKGDYFEGTFDGLLSLIKKLNMKENKK